MKTRKNLREIGYAFITPSEPVKAGTCGRWWIHYVCGKKGIKPGGGIRIEFPGLLGFSRPQTKDAEAEGYVTVVSDNPEAQMDVKVRCKWGYLHPASKRGRWTRLLIEVKLKRGHLQEGQKIMVAYGDIHRGLGVGARVTTKALKPRNFYTFKTSVDVEGRGIYQELEEHPVLEVVPAEPKEVELILPTVVKAEVKIKPKVIAKDIYHNPVRKTKRSLGLYSLQLKGLKKPLEKIRFKNSEEIIFEKENIYWIKSVNPSLHLESNPVEVRKEPLYKILWGDLHVHSSFSCDNVEEGMDMEPRECLTFGKEVAHLDFMAITDHHIPQRKRKENECYLDRKQWEILGEAIEEINKDGEFVAFFGFELTCVRGDTCVYFLTNHPPYLPPSSVSDIRGVWKYYSEEEILTIPHFHNKGELPSQEYFTNPERESVVEIASIHGIYEYLGNPTPWKSPHRGRNLRDLLNKGFKFGVIASSDDHKGQPGFQELVAVYVKEFSKKEIWEALKGRRCYATTHARIILKFELDGHPMGSEYRTENPPLVSVEVIGSDEIQKVEIIKNGKRIHEYLGKSEFVKFVYMDRQVKKGKSYYYVRVLQRNGEMAWSSPVFVDFL